MSASFKLNLIFQNTKKKLSQDKATILLDFAENYSFIIKAAVPGFHWENSHATLHPFNVYFGNTNGNLQNKVKAFV